MINILDQIVNLCNSNQIYLCFAFGKLSNYTDHLQVAKEVMENPSNVRGYNITQWWINLASWYSNQPAVAIYEFLVQPPNVQNTTLENIWWNNALVLAKAIHSKNSNAIVSVPSVNAGYIMSGFLDNPLPEENIVYEFHRHYIYDIGWQDYANSYRDGNFEIARDQMEDFFYNVVGLKMLDNPRKPVINIEFSANPTAPNWQVQFQDYIDLMEKYNVSWNTWSWVNYGLEPNFALVENDWKTLTLGGKIWADKLAESNY